MFLVSPHCCLRWADGFVVGDIPLGRAPCGAKLKAPAKAPAKAVPAKSAGGSRRRTVERYAAGYHNISYLSDACLC